MRGVLRGVPRWNIPFPLLRENRREASVHSFGDQARWLLGDPRLSDVRAEGKSAKNWEDVLKDPWRRGINRNKGGDPEDLP